MFSIGKLSRLPVWGGRDAELPSDKLPLFISLSQGDLEAVKHNTNLAIDKHSVVIQTKMQDWVRNHSTAQHLSPQKTKN